MRTKKGIPCISSFGLLSIFFFIFLTTLSSSGYSQSRYLFLKPAIKLGWEFGGGATISASISLEWYSNDFFKDLTLGKKLPLFREINKAHEDHLFLEFRMGGIITDTQFSPAIYESGLGGIFYKNDGSLRIRPKISIGYGFVFCGPGCLPTTLQSTPEVIFLNWNKLHFDLGVKSVLYLNGNWVTTFSLF